MSLELLVNEIVKPFIQEGVEDPGIFKAVFLAGGPGSGKSYVASELFGIPKKINTSAYGLKLVNQDTEFESFLKKYFGTVDIDNMPDDLFRQLTDPTYDDYSGLRTHTKALSKQRLKNYTEGRLGVIIDGTGHKYKDVKKERQDLMKLGYDTFMVFVNTSLEVAQKRNEERARVLPVKIVEKYWNSVQKNMAYFQGLFGSSNFLLIDNNKTLNPKQAQKKFNMLVGKGIGKFIKKPIKNKQAKKWVEKQRILKKQGVKEMTVVGCDGVIQGDTSKKKVKKNKNNMVGFRERGYILTAPHQSINVGGKEVSGTVMRQLLGSPDYEKDREKLFKKAFGYFDKGIFTMMNNKFKKLFESIDEFLIQNDISKILKEGSATTGSPVDDGPATFHKGFSDYRSNAEEWIESMYKDTGWELVDYMLGKHAVNPDYDYTLKYTIVPTVSYEKHGKYKKHIEDKVLRHLGYEIIKWMGISDKGVDPKSPALPGADGETENTDLKERINLDEEVQLIIEGGAYGHMNHPFDDKNITFSDLKQIIINGLGGKLNREDGVTEKLDGQNLMISWVNGKLVTARNKGQLKNFGSSAMDIKGVASKFSGRGDIRDAFVFAMKDLNKSIGSLSDKQKDKIFGNGKNWMNLEVMYPKSANVIDYDKAEIVFHGTLEYNKSGTAIGQPKGSARMLAGMIKQVNQHVQKHYTIGKPQFLTVSKVQDFGKKKAGFINRLNKLQKEYALGNTDTLAKYHQSFWEEFIYNATKQHGVIIPSKVLINLTKRWAFFDKSYKIPQIKKDLSKSPEFLDWVLSFDKNDHQNWVKQNMKPFEVLFFDVGAEILKNISGYLAASPEKAVQKIRKDVISAISKVKRGGDIKKIKTLKLQLDKLNKIGGLSAIVPSEGIVFKYNGKIYKFTGAFAPVNQILGLLNF